MKTLLVVGGCGFVGSHMVKALFDKGHRIVILDDLSTGYRDSLFGGELVVGSCGDRKVLDDIFSRYTFDGVIHFASLIQVGESVVDPARYYTANVCNAVTLLGAMAEHNVKVMVFSSTAAVYGTPNQTPIDEYHPCNPINPYGRSKWFVENILQDFDRAYGLRSVSLRYFNAAGADPQSRIGERHEPETHLIPLAIGAALETRPPLTVFGNDYDTPDGTCIRDYVHVDDLAAAHMLALEYLWEEGKTTVFNLGNGAGFSVEQVIKTVERVAGRPVPRSYGPRRPGDPQRLVASAEKAKKMLRWRPQYTTVDDMVKHAWNFECAQQKAKQGS